MWGPHGHVASPNWMEIQSGWMKWIKVILSTNGRLTSGKRGDKRGINVKKKSISSLILLESGSGGGKSNSRERKSNFSIDFSTFGSSVRVAPRNKVVLRCKGYAWTLVLWSFDNSGG